MELHEFIEFFKDKNEHYKVSDEFATQEKYVQKRGGYIAMARRHGLERNIADAEPNQKWHLLVSYYDEAEDSKKDARVCYNRLFCPELLLWIADAAGIEPKIVTEASDEAKRIIDNGANGRVRVTAGAAIRRIVPWEMIEKKIQEGKSSCTE